MPKNTTVDRTTAALALHPAASGDATARRNTYASMRRAHVKTAQDLIEARVAQGFALPEALRYAARSIAAATQARVLEDVCLLELTAAQPSL
jgi:hypothetical protein